MKQGWKHYFKELKRKSAKAVLLSVGVSLLFYLAAIPTLESGKHVRTFVIAQLFGFSIFAWIWTLYCVLWAWITLRKERTGVERKVGLQFHIVLTMFGMSCGMLTAKVLKSYLFNEKFEAGGMGESLLIGGFISLMFLFYNAYKHSREENLELKAAKTEAELHVLKNQMQPHFLFNSLNSLAELIESNKESASTMTQSLSDLYREILENSKRQLSTVESELSILRKYLALEKLRFGERLFFQIENVEEGEKIYIPSLILQTLVENAVKHGVAPSTEGGRVSVKILKNGSGFKAEVRNTGRVFVAKNTQGTGLENTKSRLDLLYGDKHEFSLQQHADYTVARFWFSGDRIVR